MFTTKFIVTLAALLCVTAVVLGVAMFKVGSNDNPFSITVSSPPVVQAPAPDVEDTVSDITFAEFVKARTKNSIASYDETELRRPVIRQQFYDDIVGKEFVWTAQLWDAEEIFGNLRVTVYPGRSISLVFCEFPASNIPYFQTKERGDDIQFRATLQQGVEPFEPALFWDFDCSSPKDG